VKEVESEPAGTEEISLNLRYERTETEIELSEEWQHIVH